MDVYELGRLVGSLLPAGWLKQAFGPLKPPSLPGASPRSRFSGGLQPLSSRKPLSMAPGSGNVYVHDNDYNPSPGLRRDTDAFVARDRQNQATAGSGPYDAAGGSRNQFRRPPPVAPRPSYDGSGAGHLDAADASRRRAQGRTTAFVQTGPARTAPPPTLAPPPPPPAPAPAPPPPPPAPEPPPPVPPPPTPTPSPTANGIAAQPRVSPPPRPQPAPSPSPSPRPSPSGVAAGTQGTAPPRPPAPTGIAGGAAGTGIGGGGAARYGGSEFTGDPYATLYSRMMQDHMAPSRAPAPAGAGGAESLGLAAGRQSMNGGMASVPNPPTPQPQPQGIGGHMGDSVRARSGGAEPTLFQGTGGTITDRNGSPTLPSQLAMLAGLTRAGGGGSSAMNSLNYLGDEAGQQYLGDSLKRHFTDQNGELGYGSLARGLFDAPAALSPVGELFGDQRGPAPQNPYPPMPEPQISEDVPSNSLWENPGEFARSFFGQSAQDRAYRRERDGTPMAEMQPYSVYPPREGGGDSLSMQ
jgi:hypothetical protein